MTPFLVIIVIGAYLAAFGAHRGQRLAMEAGTDQQGEAASLATAMPFAGAALMLLLVFSEIDHIGWNNFATITCIWVIHAAIVAGAARLGILIGFRLDEPEWAAAGAFFICLVAGPFSFAPLVLLTAF